MAGSSTHTCSDVPGTVRHVLILGGSGEATALARELVARDYDVILSLRGVIDPVTRQPCAVRVGGFGGSAGLASELRRLNSPLLIDASHPFASAMAHNAAEAAKIARVPRLRLLRPPWQPAPGDRWYEVDDLAAAVTRVVELGRRRVFLSVGRMGASAFAGLPEIHLMVRTLTPEPTISGVCVIVGRGPFSVDAECRLLTEHRIELLVSRNSGGSATAAKLAAARGLGIPVVMVGRPTQPPGEVVPDVAGALRWVENCTC